MPPRLYGYLAADAPYGVILLRGAARSGCTIGWDRATDTFTMGQWVRARVYERKCDLSPDGQHFAYFAMPHRGGLAYGTYTAISRAPYLKAVSLYEGCGTWSQGGFFTGRGEVRMLDSGGPVQDTGEVRTHGSARAWARSLLDLVTGRHCDPAWLLASTVYEARLLRDGWRKVSSSGGQWPALVTWEKELPFGWTLRKLSHSQYSPKPGRGVYWEEHELVGGAPRQTLTYPDWEWADLDRHRVVYASRGCLWAIEPEPGGLGKATCLHDFNGMVFEPIAAPY